MDKNKIIELYIEGKPLKDIKDLTGVSFSSVYAALRQNKVGEELKDIQRYFKVKWNLETDIKNGRIIFSGIFAVKFQNIIEFNILDYFKYKLI